MSNAKVSLDEQWKNHITNVYENWLIENPQPIRVKDCTFKQDYDRLRDWTYKWNAVLDAEYDKFCEAIETN